MKELAEIGGFANHLSIELTGLPTDRAGYYASAVHAKMCAHARSIGAICHSSMMDHSALLNLARMMIEALNMYSYLAEDVEEEEWDFRHLVIRLHDTVNRINFVRVAPEAGGLNSLNEGRRELENSIREHPRFSDLPDGRGEKLLQGQEMFVTGMRRVAKLAVGWDSDSFNSIYSYLSAHSHTSPMSFMRAKELEYDFYNPSDAQIGMINMAIIVAGTCLRRVTLRMLDKHPEKYDRFPIEFVEVQRKDDAEAGLFRAS